MTTETMNVHKALAELKVIDSRIQKEIQSTKFVSEHVAGNDRVEGIKVDDFVSNAKAKRDKIKDMLIRRDALHRAVQLSNASTKVQISGKEYTVAEAIWMRQYGTIMMKEFAHIVSSQYRGATKKVDDVNNRLEQEADVFIKNIYENQKDGKADPESIARTRKDYIESRKHELVDPIDAAKVIDEMNSEVESFMADVDTALSTSNAITEIEVSY